MATTIHEPPGIVDTTREANISFAGRGGNQGRSPANRDLRGVDDYAPPPASTGIWVVVAAISMTFAAFTSALVVRKGGAPDWQHLTLPSILYFNTVLLLVSSVTLEVARHRVTLLKGSIYTEDAGAVPWLYATLGLGLLFVAGQYIAWQQLRAQGLYVATNPNSSFFYLLTAAHALHVLGGLGGLLRVLHKLKSRVLRRSTLDATSRYWHFMGVLWLYLLFLLWMQL